MEELKLLSNRLANSDSDIKSSKILYEIIDLLRINSKFDMSLEYLEKLISVKERLGDFNEVNELKFRVANNLNILSRLDESEKILDKLLSEEIDKTLRIKIYILKSMILTKRSQFKESEKYLDLSLKEINFDDNLDELAKIYMMKGILAKNMDKNVEAYEFFLQSHYLYTKLGNDNQIANLAVWLSSVLEELNDLEAAINYLFSALEISKKIRSIKNYGNMYNSLAIKYCRLNDFNSCEKYLNLALQQFKQMKIDGKIASVYSNLGKLYFDMGEYDESLKYLDLAITHRGEVEAHLNLMAYSISANIYLFKGDLDSANSFMEKIECVERIKSFDKKSNLLELLELKYAYHNGDMDQFEKINKRLIDQFDSLDKNTFDDYFNFIKKVLKEKGKFEELSELYEKYLLRLEINNREKDKIYRKFISVKHDILEKVEKLYEEREENSKLHKINEQLKAAQEDIVKLEKRNTALAMGVTINHEIKQPLSVIIGYIGLLDVEKSFTPKQLELVEKIKRNHAKIVTLVERYKNILNFEEREYVKGINMVSIDDD